jgi:hypothetical protein
MGEPISDEVLDALLARAGIALDPAGRASLRVGAAGLAALLERLHHPRALEVEPAPVFAPLQGER